MLETTTSFSDISSIQPFKKQELLKIKERITTLQSQDDVQEEDTDEYLRTILSEQHVLQYFAHARHLRHFFSQHILHDNKLVKFSFTYQVLTLHISKGLKVMLKYLSTLHTNMRSIKRVVNASDFYTTHSEFIFTVISYIKELKSDIATYSRRDIDHELSTWLEINEMKSISLTYTRLPSDLRKWDEFRRFDRILTQSSTSRSRKK